MKKIIQLKDLEPGDKVWCGCDSGFCHDSIQTVKKIKYRYDEKTGEKYKVIVLSEKQWFGSRDGHCIKGALAYYLEPCEQKK